jgi:hypothetical protein
MEMSLTVGRSPGAESGGGRNEWGPSVACLLWVFSTDSLNFKGFGSLIRISVPMQGCFSQPYPDQLCT